MSGTDKQKAGAGTTQTVRRSGKPISSRSSLLIWPAVIAVLGIAGILAGFRGKWLLSGVLLLLFLLTLFSRLWAAAAGSGLEIRLEELSGSRGCFPGDRLEFGLKLQNHKLLPLTWAELFQPLPAGLCVLPEQVRPVEEWEKPVLQAAGVSVEQAGELQLMPVRWYGTAETTVALRSVHRGVWSTALWTIRTGDGLGLCQVELPLQAGQTGEYAVYPALREVRTGPFLQQYWNAETGPRGVMEDVTVIRSTREYVPGDPVKHINWRLTARGLPLTVNVYEEILPGSVHFVLDGESFSGPEKHPEALEETLSILASLLCALEEEGLQCGLSVCRGAHTEAVTCLGADGGPDGLEAMLWQLAAYEPLPDLRTGDTGTVVRQASVYDTENMLYGLGSCGRGYYIAYSAGELSPSVLAQLPVENTTLLLWETEPACEGFDVLSLRSLEGGGSR